jgi:hypothetical protein
MLYPKLSNIIKLILLVHSCHGKPGGSSSALRNSAARKAEQKKEEDQAACLQARNKCSAVTASVTSNLIRPMPCEDSNPCVVVVHNNINTTSTCTQWSPYAFWDGENCFCRCEALGGALTNLNVSWGEKWCYINNTAVIRFDAFTQLEEFDFDSAAMFGHPVNTELYLAPMKCGTWLGDRDSTLKDSWFHSPCFVIIQNRDRLDETAKIHPCGLDRYTTGCRFLGPWVPECRTSDTSECGVQIPCPSLNPCGLNADINVNLDNSFHKCTPTTFLALNVTSTAKNCNEWSSYAFVLDGRCVSSCGNIDSKCSLNGKDIPRCNTVRTGNTIGSISPTVCAVPVRSDTYSGVRNGFFGMSRLTTGSNCLLSTNCSNRSACSAIEGIHVTSSQPFFQTDRLPSCAGDHSEPCKIVIPCIVPPTPFTCKDTLVGISELIYSHFNVHDCKWFSDRDKVTITTWALSCIPIFLRMEETIKWLDADFGIYPTIISWVYAIIFAALGTVWEFTAAALIIIAIVYNVVDYALSSTYQPASDQEATASHTTHKLLKLPESMRENQHETAEEEQLIPQNRSNWNMP